MNAFTKKTIAPLVLLAAALVFGSSADAQNISTVVGDGSQGYTGDNIPAINSGLYYPLGMALDSRGNLYIADQVNQRIRKVTPAGVITTVAGNGIAGFSGDGGPAVDASLAYPSGVLVNALGELYITDRINHRIRKVGVDGIIHTIAGNGVPTFAGDGGPATSASLRGPFDVVFDAAGNMYIADDGNRRIRKVDTAGIITTVAGNGINDYTSEGLPATQTPISNAQGIAIDSSGRIYFSDFGNNCVRYFVPGGQMFRFSYTGPCIHLFDAQPHLDRLSGPTGLGFDSAGNLYVSDTYNSRIVRLDTFGSPRVVAGSGVYGFSGDGGPATLASMSWTAGVRVAPNFSFFLSDALNNRVRKVAAPTAVQLIQQLYLDASSPYIPGDQYNRLAFPLWDTLRVLSDKSSRNDFLACGYLDQFIRQAEIWAVARLIPDATAVSFEIQARQAKRLLVCR